MGSGDINPSSGAFAQSDGGTTDHVEAGLRVGVVGCGYWGSKHLRVLQSLDGVSAVVAIDPDPSRVASLRRSLSLDGNYASLEDALPHVDALIVATPPSTHVELGVQAMQAGKHVLIEKPLATSTEGALQLVEVAKNTGMTLMVGHTFEYNSAVWTMRDLIRSGSLGKLYYVDSARLNLGLYQGNVNVICDLAPHDISILNYLLEDQPTAVEVWGSRHAHNKLEDVAYLRLQYEARSVEANIHVSWLDPKKVRRITAVGSQKMAVYNDLETEERIRVFDKGVMFSPSSMSDDDQSQLPMTYRYGDITAPYVDFREPLGVEDGHFISCIRTGETPVTDGLNGLAVCRVLDAAQASLREHRAILLEEIPGADVANRTLTLAAPSVA
jgi:predicted dehydrogenase